MKAKKFKGKGGNSHTRKKLLQSRIEKKLTRKKNRLFQGKAPKIIADFGYIFTYTAEITDRLYTFADLHKIKLVDTISIYSKSNDRYSIDFILNNRKNWPYNNEISYIDYKFKSVDSCPSAKLQIIRQSNGYTIEINEGLTMIEKSLLDSSGKFKCSTYSCYTNLDYLKFLYQKYHIKGLLFSQQGQINNKTFLLKDFAHFKGLIKKGNVLVTNDFFMDKCLKIRDQLGYKVEYIYDSTLLPKTVTKDHPKRKPKEGKPRYGLNNDPEKQRLVCITDGISVHRLKWYRAVKIVNRFPAKIKFCTKSEYNKYLNETKSNPYLPKDKRELVRTLSTQGDKKDSKNTNVRKDRRIKLQKRKFHNRLYFQQQIPATQEWVVDPNDENYEILIQHPSKTINVRRSRYKHLPRASHIATRNRKARLMEAYKSMFSGEERRNDKFSKVEEWSKQFMTILKMVKENKPEWKIAKYISEIYPGWNDKKIKRFITYLKVTKHGLNYKPNREKKVVLQWEKIEKDVKGIKINKLPYYQPIAAEYKVTDSDKSEKIVREQNTYIQKKTLIKEDPETKELIVLCPIADIVRFVAQENYKDDDTCPWKPLVEVTTFKKVGYKKIPFHLQKPTKKKKTWKHPIKDMPF